MRSTILISLGVVLLMVQAVRADDDQGAQLLSAAKQGDVNQVRALLDDGVDANSTNRYGATALSFAANRGYVEIARLLVVAGVNVNAKDSFYGATALHWAADSGNREIVQLLLYNGATGAVTALRGAAGKGSEGVVAAVLATEEISFTEMRSCRALAKFRGHIRVVALFDDVLGESTDETFTVAEETLSDYAGLFLSEQGVEYTVSSGNGLLVLTTIYGNSIPLLPQEEDKFVYFEVVYAFTRKGEAVVSLDRAGTVHVRSVPGTEPAHEEPSTTAAVEPDAAAAVEFGSPHWPQFRGMGARGIADGQQAPASWDVEQGTNVRWKVRVPGLAHACPVVWGDHVFVTTAVNQNDDASLRIGIYGDVEAAEDDLPHAWRVICLDRMTGNIVWARTAHEGVPTSRRHLKSSHANCTPVTDGHHVVCLFGTEGLFCYDVQGNLLWRKLLGDLGSGWFYDENYEWGFGSSPIIFEDRVIVQCDVQQGSFIAAYNIETGAELWKVARDEIPTWGTPTIFDGADDPLLITNGTRQARGYDPRTGEELWHFAGHSEISVPTPFVANGLIYITSGYRPNKPIYAVRPGARGDISLQEGATTNDHIAWSAQEGGPYLPTPIVYRNHLYVCTNRGILTCYAAETGKQIYRERVRGGGAKSFSASLVAADGRLYLTSEEGVVLVVQAGPEFKLLHVNPVGEYCLSTPAIAQGLFLIRTARHLVAIGQE